MGNWSDHKRKNNESGASLVELAVAFPVVILLLFIIVDAGLMLGQYVVLSRTTYEAARLASHTASLEESCYGEKEGCGDILGAPAHAQLQGRIQYLASKQSSVLGTIGITSALETTYSGDNGSNVSNIVWVELESDYTPFLPSFGTIALRSRVNSTYLHKPGG
ncbi:MAG: pilus assembly protein, partial [Bdellovibrionales bacterium]|nr:pilus assembly protein [Bdellovibrionales bacterium]